MSIDKINRVVLSTDVKDTIDNKAEKVELQALKTDLENQINNVYSNILRKPSVPTFADLSIVYPNAVSGWTVTVDDTSITYQYDDVLGWFATTINAIPKATDLVDGLLSKEDKAKLDTVSPDAEKNKTNQEIMDDLKTIDGHGSGLDADLLDGRHATDFADAGHNHNTMYYQKNEVNILVNGKAERAALDNHVADESKHFKTNEKNEWNKGIIEVGNTPPAGLSLFWLDTRTP